MAAEIELKAHVRDHENLKMILAEKAEYLFAFEKDDVYWSAAGCIDSCGLKAARIRVRRETLSFSDGSVESRSFVTHKVKMLRDGIELNDELEFEAKPAGNFEELLVRMGLKPADAKHKRGWAYQWNGIRLELTEVRKLGWFVELEILADTHDKDEIETAFVMGKERLLAFLDRLGIEDKAIEERFYSELLSQENYHV